jgi:hypothetical protein
MQERKPRLTSVVMRQSWDGDTSSGVVDTRIVGVEIENDKAAMYSGRRKWAE